MTMKEAALKYHAMGLHVIPCAPKSKRPLVPWKDYQTTPPSLEMINVWWSQTPDANVALVLGRGLFAVDLDGGAEAERLLADAGITLPTDAPRSRTGHGAHVFLSSFSTVPDRVGLLATNGGKPQVDIRGVGIVIAPPSIHPDGPKYLWEVPLTKDRPPAAPQELLGLIHANGNGNGHGTGQPTASDVPAGETWLADAFLGVGDGLRDVTCTRLAGYLLGKGLPASSVETILTTGFARNCTPPFPPKDVTKCVRSIARRETMDGKDIVPGVVTLSQALDELLAQMEVGAAPTVPTPFPTLNKWLDGGFSPGNFILIGARPGIGKTALALELARRAANAKRSVLIVSREMTKVALTRRMLAQDSRIPASLLRRAEIEGDDSVRFYQSITRLRSLPVYLTDEAVSLEQINQLVASMRSLGLVVVDYLQLVRAPREIRERRLQVEHVSAGLKTLALLHQVPVVCLSSLNRPPDGKPAKPTLASLRESGELEHDADVVLLLHREDDTQPQTICAVAKNREGRLGDLNLYFHAEYVGFEEIDQLSEVGECRG